MAVPANICIAWPSTVGSIPSGWTRETSLDSRYILGASTGADTDLSTDRGNTTHIHTSPSHTPTQNAHTHEFSVAQNTADSSIVSGTVLGAAADFTHGHDAQTSAAATATNTGVVITVDATANDLAFCEVIWIKSDGTPTTFPTGCLAFFASDSLPSGWSRVQGDRYLKGASSGGGGGTTGGANTHTHTSPAHTHGQNNHNHAAVTSGSGNVAAPGKGLGADTPANAGHTHQVSLDATAASNQSVTTTLDAASHEPPYTKLNIVTPASPSLPTNIVALWLGLNSAIPSGWTRFTAMDGRWLKGAAADGQSGVDTGGGTQHTHSASDCQPVQNAHSHSATDAGSTATIASAPGVANTFAANNHRHTGWSVTSDTATNNAVAVTINDNTADSALPKHRTVIYVQFTGTTPPPTRTGVLTVYETGLFETGVNRENVGPKLTPEQEWAIWHGDTRYYPGLLPGGPPR